MSGIEIYGAVAATVGLIKLCAKTRDTYKKNSRSWESFDRATRAVESLHKDLLTSAKAIDGIFKKYQKDIEKFLDSDDKAAISSIKADLNMKGDECQDLVKKLQKVLRKEQIKAEEFNALRTELSSAVAAVQSLQLTFSTHMAMIGIQINRQLSISPSNPEARNLTDPPDGDLMNPHHGISRATTWGSSVSTVSPLSTGRSSVGYTDSGKSIKFIKSERLQLALERGDLSTVMSFVEAGGREVESRKASALLYACRYRKLSIVEHLLSIHASIHIYNEKGLGVLHRTIGTCPSVERSPPEIVNIIKLLLRRGASLATADKTEFRRTPLHHSIVTGNIDAAKYILQKDSDLVDKVDADKKTALYLACEDHSPNPDLIKLLLEYGASFGKRKRCKIENRKKRGQIDEMLDYAEAKRPLTVK